MHFQGSSLILTVILLSSLGCSPSSNESEALPREVPFTYEDGAFKKIARTVSERDLNFEAQAANTEQFSSGRVFVKAGRKHMVPNESHNQFALYKNEALVFDMLLVPINLEPTELDITVLINFRPVKFELHLVEEGSDFPETSDDNSRLIGDAPEPSYSHRMPMRADSGNAYTLAVLPEDIPSMGGLDVRVIISVLDLSGSLAVRQIRESDLSYSVTVYREGSEFPALTSLDLVERPSRQHRPNTDLLGFMSPGFSNSALIIDHWLENQFYGLDVTGKQPYSGEEELLALHYADHWWKRPMKILSGFRLNGEWLDEWTHEPVNPSPNGAIGENDTASVRAIKLDPTQLGEGRLEFIAFARPFEDQGELDEHRRLIEQSNVLYLE